MNVRRGVELRGSGTRTATLILLGSVIAHCIVLEAPGHYRIFEHVPASFGTQSDLYSARLVAAYPPDGCPQIAGRNRTELPRDELKYPLRYPKRRESTLGKTMSGGDPEEHEDGSGEKEAFVMLLSRGSCNFTQKVRWAQSQGAAGAIIQDDKPRGNYWGVIMSGENEGMAEYVEKDEFGESVEDDNGIDDGRLSNATSERRWHASKIKRSLMQQYLDPIRIPSVFVSFETGNLLREYLENSGHDDREDSAKLEDMPPFLSSSHLSTDSKNHDRSPHSTLLGGVGSPSATLLGVTRVRSFSQPRDTEKVPHTHDGNVKSTDSMDGWQVAARRVGIQRSIFLAGLMMEIILDAALGWMPTFFFEPILDLVVTSSSKYLPFRARGGEPISTLLDTTGKAEKNRRPGEDKQDEGDTVPEWSSAGISSAWTYSWSDGCGSPTSAEPMIGVATLENDQSCSSTTLTDGFASFHSYSSLKSKANEEGHHKETEDSLAPPSLSTIIQRNVESMNPVRISVTLNGTGDAMLNQAIIDPLDILIIYFIMALFLLFTCLGLWVGGSLLLAILGRHYRCRALNRLETRIYRRSRIYIPGSDDKDEMAPFDVATRFRRSEQSMKDGRDAFASFRLSRAPSMFHLALAPLRGLRRFYSSTYNTAGAVGNVIRRRRRTSTSFSSSSPLDELSTRALIEETSEHKSRYLGRQEGECVSSSSSPDIREGVKEPDVVDSMEYDEAKKNGWEDTSSTCSICLDEYEDGVSLLAILPCGHTYHKKCIVPWLEHRSVECPLCKRPFTSPNAYPGPKQTPSNLSSSSHSVSSSLPPVPFSATQLRINDTMPGAVGIEFNTRLQSESRIRRRRWSAQQHSISTEVENSMQSSHPEVAAGSRRVASEDDTDQAIMNADWTTVTVATSRSMRAENIRIVALIFFAVLSSAFVLAGIAVFVSYRRQ